MIYQLPQETRDSIITYLQNSILPAKDATQIIKVLIDLKEIKKEEVKK